MIVKTENCLYCGQKMESKTAKKKFCCDLHRVYWNREKKMRLLLESMLDENSSEIMKTKNDLANFNMSITKTENGKIRRVDPLSKEAQVAIYNSTHPDSKVFNEEIPPMPKKEDFKDSLEFAAAKNDWKLKYGQQ